MALAGRAGRQAPRMSSGFNTQAFDKAEKNKESQEGTERPVRNNMRILIVKKKKKKLAAKTHLSEEQDSTLECQK